MADILIIDGEKSFTSDASTKMSETQSDLELIWSSNLNKYLLIFGGMYLLSSKFQSFKSLKQSKVYASHVIGLAHACFAVSRGHSILKNKSLARVTNCVSFWTTRDELDLMDGVQAYFLVDLAHHLFYEPSPTFVFHHVMMTVSVIAMKLNRSGGAGWALQSLLSEVTSILLNFLWLMRHHGIDKKVPRLTYLLNTLFVVMFIAFRVIFLTFFDVKAAQNIVKSPFPSNLMKGTAVSALTAFLSLQYIWGYFVVRKWIRIVWMPLFGKKKFK